MQVHDDVDFFIPYGTNFLHQKCKQKLNLASSELGGKCTKCSGYAQYKQYVLCANCAIELDVCNICTLGRGKTLVKM